MLGITLDAPNDTLILDPTLPDWLPDITLRGLRLANDSYDIAFTREESGTVFRVLRGDPERVRRPASATPTTAPIA